MASSSEQVIELSVEETNKLRAELGLKPLRGVHHNRQEPATTINKRSTAEASTDINNEVLELSVEETNALRAKLGLKPLRTTASSAATTGRSASTAIHKPPPSTSGRGEQEEVQKRLEKAKLAREVQEGIQKTFAAKGLGEQEEDDGLDSWAQKMRNIRDGGEETSKKEKKKKKKKKATSASGPDASYSSKDLDGIHVSHATSDFEAGSTTILTLADTELLEKKDPQSAKVIGLQDGTSVELENVNMTEAQQTSDSLRQKRQLEMGVGHAGGYAGHDDEEFEEHMGALGPSSANRGGVSGPDQHAHHQPKRGFTIGGNSSGTPGKEGGVAGDKRKVAVSLEPTIVDTMASDTMTQEEYEATLEKKKQKDSKFKAKKSKKKKKKKSSRRSTVADDDDTAGHDSGTLLAELTATASTTSNKRRRRRSDSEEDAGVKNTTTQTSSSLSQKRSRYEETVEKANARSKAMFAPTSSKLSSGPTEEEDEEPDDDFLQEALAKARRLQKLRRQPVVADAVAQALQKEDTVQEADGSGDVASSKSGVLFQLDETREFTRALRAREEQEERRKTKRQVQQKEQTEGQLGDSIDRKTKDVEMQDVEEGSNQDIEELAKQIKHDDDSEDADAVLDGTTASKVAIGRGMAGVLSMLQQTGDISNNRPKEEMRGRAKDERTYGDYEDLDLKKVVRIGPNATAKDREMASREISLEYRDEHGRLLTRKEAYRNLCYQFHGHGSGKTNQERRLKQIQREQAERRLANSQATSDRSVLGALKATQKATGKAFVVHKTGH